MKLYASARWAAGKISLLDYLRKTGESGQILQWLQAKHRESESTRALEQFAAEYKMAGEKLVAADMLSRLNDRFYGQWLMLHVPFKDPQDFVKPLKSKLARVPREHRNFAMAILCEHPAAAAMWQDPEAVKEELRMEAHVKAFQDTLLGMLQANRTLVEKYISGQADAEQEEQAREAGRQQELPVAEEGALNKEQKHVASKVNEAVDRFLAVQAAEEGERGLEEKMAEACAQGRIFVCTGGPGTGKTTVALACVRRTLDQGGRVLFVYPTNRQASRMRKRLPPEVVVNTYHAGFGLDEAPGNQVVSLAQYALIVVDEISQMQAEHFDHICRLWVAADRLPAILFAGDELQVAGFGDRAWQSPRWRTTTYRKKLHQVYRCKDPKFNQVLQELRTSRPSKTTLQWLQQQKAWTPPGPPTVRGLQTLFKEHPNTVVLTCTRKGAFAVNEMALKALFPRHDAMVVVKADVESNPANYDESGSLVEPSLRQPTELPIFTGAKVCFTRNVRKDVDYVNGMDAKVLAYHPHSQAVEVLTDTGHRVMVWPWSDVEADGLTYYPLKGGYADTLLKYQGAELDHVTVFLDAESVPGAAYTALSRVSYAKDVVIGGLLKYSHFQPADETGSAR